MSAYKAEAVVEKDGSLTLHSVPFRAGERVEVLVVALPIAPKTADEYPLRGTPYRYDDPTAPVADQDWEALE